MSWYSEYPSCSNLPVFNESKLRFYIKELPSHSEASTKGQKNTGKKPVATKRKQTFDEGVSKKKKLANKTKKLKSNNVTKDNFI